MSHQLTTGGSISNLRPVTSSGLPLISLCSQRRFHAFHTVTGRAPNAIRRTEISHKVPLWWHKRSSLPPSV